MIPGFFFFSIGAERILHGDIKGHGQVNLLLEEFFSERFIASPGAVHDKHRKGGCRQSHSQQKLHTKARLCFHDLPFQPLRAFIIFLDNRMAKTSTCGRAQLTKKFTTILWPV
jgi:hypothetical protein